jgi:hypothetical protein
VIVRVSAARDLGDVDGFKFYDHSKALTAAPPDVLRVNEKNLREHYVPNVAGVIITTNHKTDGIFVPADDRHHFVAWSECDREDFPEAYWNALWRWYLSGGLGHVGGVSPHARPVLVRCESAAAEDGCVLGNHRCAPCAGRRRARGRVGPPRDGRPRDRRKGMARCGDAA